MDNCPSQTRFPMKRIRPRFRQLGCCCSALSSVLRLPGGRKKGNGICAKSLAHGNGTKTPGRPRDRLQPRTLRAECKIHASRSKYQRPRSRLRLRLTVLTHTNRIPYAVVTFAPLGVRLTGKSRISRSRPRPPTTNACSSVRPSDRRFAGRFAVYREKGKGDSSPN